MTSTDQRFPQTQRLRARSEFKHVERKGRRRSGPSFIVYAAANSLDSSRVGLTVSRKVGHAVRRNRWKRRLREIFRRNKDHYPSGFDFVVIVKHTASGELEFETLRDELLTLMNEASAPK